MFRYFTRKADATKFANAVMEINGGYQPSWFRDGKSWRIQDDRLGNEQADAILHKLGLDA